MRVNRNDTLDSPPDLLYQDDADDSLYALVLSIDDAHGYTAATDQVYMSLDAALVAWYRQLANPAQPPALNNVAQASEARLLECIVTPTEFHRVNQYLLTTTRHALEECSWWLITPAWYNFRASIHLEQFLPAANEADPAGVGHSDSRYTNLFVLPRLIVPRSLFAQRLFSLRDLF